MKRLLLLIGILSLSACTSVQRYWKDGGYTFPTLLDPKAKLSEQFGVFTQPTTVFLNADGEIIFKKNGPLTGERLKPVRSDIVQFKTMYEQHPNARILSTDTGERRDYSRDPYEGYERDSDTYDVGGVRIEASYDVDSQAVIFRNAETGEEIIPLYGFWFSWVAQYPATNLYQE